MEDQIRHSDQIARDLQRWKTYARSLEAKLNENTAVASGALITLNAVIQAMQEQMSPMQRETFRQAVVNKSRYRILEVDEKNAKTSGAARIREEFAKHSACQQLGII